MTYSTHRNDTAGLWPKLAAIVLVVAALGLPINDLFRYALLVVATVALFTGATTLRASAWFGALAIVVIAVIAQIFLAAPRIEEGHNVFLPGEQGRALEAGLPAEVHRFMAARFDAQYPPERRCQLGSGGCWQSQPGLDRVFAFSADGLLDRPSYSRRVTDIDLADAVWLRLGFINESHFNWYSGASDVQRNARERRFWMVLHPWRLTMPFFVMYRFPADFLGSRLCWRGEVLWEGADERFSLWRHPEMACRTIEADDIGRRIFGVSIAKEAPLAMKLVPSWTIQLRQLLEPAVALVAVVSILALLVTWSRRRMVLPLGLIGMSLVVVLFNDASFIGGVRPFDGGDDGLFYEGLGRAIARHLSNGNVLAALEGGEKVFFYGGPGLRYFRAGERFLFGDSFLGYLSLLLILPFAVFAVFRRFLSLRAALALTLIFIAVPVGGLFGTTFYLYAKWASRGFADPAAYTFFIAGLAVLVGRTAQGPDARFGPAFAAAFLIALGLFMRPIIAPAVALVLAGAGLAALWQHQFRRLAGLCLGFLPAFSMALHNWYFGGVFVLFSGNAGHPQVFVTPPSVYLAAAGELLRLDFTGGHMLRAMEQIGDWLTGPTESYAMVPVHVAAVAILIRVAGWARNTDPWVRLIAWAALAQHCVGLTHVPTARYYYLAWFLTLLVVAVWIRDEGIGLLKQKRPDLLEKAKHNRVSTALNRVLDWWSDRLGVSEWAKRA